MARSLIANLTGAVNGVNRNYAAPSAFVTGTAKVVINGVTYAASDSYWGFVETSSTTIRMTTPPKTGFVMQLFYVEQELTGTPFDPSGEYP